MPNKKALSGPIWSERYKPMADSTKLAGWVAKTHAEGNQTIVIDDDGSRRRTVVWRAIRAGARGRVMDSYSRSGRGRGQYLK